MTTTNIHEAKSQLSKLIEQAENGEEVIIARAGKPVARLIAYKAEESSRQGGQWQGLVKMADDFDALPDQIAEAFGMLASREKRKSK